MIKPWDIGTKLIIIQTDPGLEHLLTTLVFAGMEWFPCCPTHGGKQLVFMEDNLNQNGMYPIKWMKPWLDDLDIDQKDVDAIRGLTTPNKSDTLTKVSDQMKDTINRLANTYKPRNSNER